MRRKIKNRKYMKRAGQRTANNGHGGSSRMLRFDDAARECHKLDGHWFVAGGSGTALTIGILAKRIQLTLLYTQAIQKTYMKSAKAKRENRKRQRTGQRDCMRGPARHKSHTRRTAM